MDTRYIILRRYCAIWVPMNMWDELLGWSNLSKVMAHGLSREEALDLIAAVRRHYPSPGMEYKLMPIDRFQREELCSA